MHDHFEWGILVPMFWGVFALCIVYLRSTQRHSARMKALEISRELSEKGVALPPEVAEALKAPVRLANSPAADLRNGVLSLAIAAGLVMLAAVLQYNRMGPEGIHPLFGVAAFPALIGLALIGLSFGARRKDL